MQGGRDPFGNPFGNPFGGFGNHRSLMSSFFGDRDPFDDAFFTNPFGGMLGPSLFDQNGSGFGSSIFGPSRSPFESNFIGPSPFMNMETPGFIEHQPPQIPRSTGPIIEELNSDDENEEKEGNADSKDPKKDRISRDEPFVEIPDDETGERSNQMQARNDFNRISGSSSSIQSLPQARSFTFQSSSVTYGGANGQYYTSSTTKRSGSDGLTFEEHKEADSATRQAAHRISKGLHKKGHSVTRKLNSDGRVQSTQTLHNLNPDELSGFEETWKGNAAKQLPGWNSSMNTQGAIGSGSSGPYPPSRGGGWAALPAAGGGSSQSASGVNTESGAGHLHSNHAVRTKPDVGKRKGSSSAGMGQRMMDK